MVDGCVTDLYFYNNRAVVYANNRKPSIRGELGITHLNHIYLEIGNLNIELFGQGFTWLNTGTHESSVETTNFGTIVENRQHIKIVLSQTAEFCYKIIDFYHLGDEGIACNNPEIGI